MTTSARSDLQNQSRIMSDLQDQTKYLV